MRIFLDFDDTLYNTTRLKKETNRVIADFGVTKEFQEVLKKDEEKGTGMNFDRVLKDVFDSLGKDKKAKFDFKKLKQKINRILNKKKSMLYSDSLPFLKAIYKKHDLILITYGDYRAQRFKIKQVGIRRFFKAVLIVTEKKEEFFRDYLKKREGVFIDDKASTIDFVAKNFLDIKTIVLRRPGSWHSKKPFGKYDFLTRNLSQTLKIINNLEKTCKQ